MRMKRHNPGHPVYWLPYLPILLVIGFILKLLEAL